MVTKSYDSKKTQCRVTFMLPKTVRAAMASVVGDFNNWDRHATPMKRMSDGSWQAIVMLECGREYHFRYLINGREWHNEWEADRYAVHPLGGENSVLVL